MKNIVNREEFIRYENLRKSGLTNMYDIEYVKSVTWLSKEQIIYIMENYQKLADKFLEENK